MADPTQDPATNGETTTLTLSFDGTKTALVDGKTTWAEGDKIRIYNSNGKFFNDVTVPAEAVGKAAFDVEVNLKDTVFFAVYPVEADKGVSGGKVSVALPSNPDGRFASANICVAATKTNTLAFQNVTAVLKVTISSGNVVDINALANARPNLRIIRISADRLTTGKEDPVTTKIEHIYRNGGVTDNWTAVGAKHKAQGTSSLAYGLAALNLDIDMANASSWTDAEGEPVTSYAMTENSIPVTYFNIKLNVASSENANNVLLADDYNTYQPWLSPARSGSAGSSRC